MKTEQEILERYKWYVSVANNPKVYHSIAREYADKAKGLAWTLNISEHQIQEDLKEYLKYE